MRISETDKPRISKGYAAISGKPTREAGGPSAAYRQAAGPCRGWAAPSPLLLRLKAAITSASAEANRFLTTVACSCQLCAQSLPADAECRDAESEDAVPAPRAEWTG